jgi:hypothetical protein
MGRTIRVAVAAAALFAAVTDAAATDPRTLEIYGVRLGDDANDAYFKIVELLKSDGAPPQMTLGRRRDECSPPSRQELAARRDKAPSLDRYCAGSFQIGQCELSPRSNYGPSYNPGHNEPGVCIAVSFVENPRRLGSAVWQIGYLLTAPENRLMDVDAFKDQVIRKYGKSDYPDRLEWSEREKVSEREIGSEREIVSERETVKVDAGCLRTDRSYCWIDGSDYALRIAGLEASEKRKKPSITPQVR